MSGDISFVDLTRRVGERANRFNQQYIAGMSLMASGNPAGSIPVFAECEATGRAILQDQESLFNMQQTFWKTQLAGVLLENATACSLTDRLVEARETAEAVRRLVQPGSNPFTEARLSYLEAQLMETGIIPGDPARKYDEAIEGFSAVAAWQNAAQASRLAAIWVLRNGNYRSFRDYSAKAAALAEQHGFPALAITFRIETARSELLAANTALDLEELRKEIDYDFALRGAIANRLSALRAGVPEAFASFDGASPQAADSMKRLADYTRNFGLSYPGSQLDQAAPQSAGILVKEIGLKVEAAYAALRVDALMLAAEFKLRLNDPDTAHDALAKAEAEAHTDAALLRGIYMDRAALFEAERNMPAAIRAAEMAVEVSAGLPAIGAEQAVLALNRLRHPDGAPQTPSTIEDQVNVALQNAGRLFAEKQFEAAIAPIADALAIVKTPSQRRMLLGHRTIAYIELGRFAEAVADADAAIELFAQSADLVPSAEDLQNRIAEEENLHTMKALAEARLGHFDRAWFTSEQGRATMLKRDIARLAGPAFSGEGTEFQAFRSWLISERAAVLSIGAPTRWGTLIFTAGPDDTAPHAAILPFTGSAMRQVLASGDLFDGLPQVSAALLHPLRERILAIAKNSRVLYAMPTSQLFQAPFAALSIEEGINARTLADLCPVALAPSAAILLWCAAWRNPPRSRSLLAAGVGASGACRFSDQARAVAALDWPAERELLLDADATAANVAAKAPQHSVLYIAAHGVLNSDVHESMAASEIKFADRCLNAREVLGWRLNAEMVFLNACQSGLFRTAGQSQVNGFFRAFPAAGASTLIAALANIDPVEAGDLSQAFFRAWLGGAAKIDALHQAQQEIRKRPGATARDWAAHCLIGDFV
jgi:tetratricopeptide (TPR) repeat protein